MKISIAMATYNGAKFLQQQLDSFVGQSRLPDELIVSDDLSSDETITILEGFAQTAPFEVRIIRNHNNLGYAQNFSRALAQCTGDLIFLSDQDDVWFKDKIAAVEAYALKNPSAQLIINDALLTDSNLNEVGLTKLGQIRSAGLSDDAFVMGCCCAIKRDFLNICMPIPSGFDAHDDWIVYFSSKSRVKHVLEKCYQYYRRHEQNQSDFIANRTRKISKLDVFTYHFKKRIHSRGTAQIAHAIKQKELRILGVKRALGNRNNSWKEEMKVMLEEEQESLLCLQRRKLIRESCFHLRVRLIFQSLASGGYKNARVIKSALSDLLG